jgi:diacylglycerol O-acyltransferase-1
MATTTAGSSFEGRDNGVTRRVKAGARSETQNTNPSIANASTTSIETNDIPNGSAHSSEQLRRAFRKKYRHVEAIHSQSRPSCLSHDTTETPSFLGFRNLMVIVLGMMPFTLRWTCMIYLGNHS